MKKFDPDAPVPWYNNTGAKPTTMKEFYWDPLPDEALRDIARNEANEWKVRKAAVKVLLERGSVHANLPYFALFMAEIKAEDQAREEVIAAVESATEQALPSEKELLEDKIKQLEAELEAYRKPVRPI